MPSSTTIRVADDSGNFLFETAQFLDAGNSPGLRYILSCGQIGALTVTLPPEFNSKLVKDGRIHVMRSVNGGTAQREGGSCFLIRKWEYAGDWTTITAVHANDILRRRHSLYIWFIGLTGAGGGSASINNSIVGNAPADDCIKAIWRRNFGASIDTTYRGWSTVTSVNDDTQADISAYVSVEADESAGPNVYKQLFFRNTLEAMQEIINFSVLEGTYLTAEIVAPTEETLQLRTYTDQRGVDRRFSAGSGLVFTEERGNIANSLLTVDALEEITFAQSIGAGPDEYYRYTGYALDTARMGQTIFGRIEGIFDAGSAPNDANLTSAAKSMVRGGRPVISASGELQETDQCIRGVHFNYGDYVTVEVQGIQYDMRLDVLDVSLNAGVETTRVSFYSDG